MAFLDFMGQGILEEVRCRVYGGSNEPEDERVIFLNELATVGVIDCPAYDVWVAALQDRGWLPAKPELEQNPDGPGKIGRWLLTPKGRAGWVKF
jgi:hypothetical protein